MPTRRSVILPNDDYGLPFTLALLQVSLEEGLLARRNRRRASEPSKVTPLAPRRRALGDRAH